MIGEVCWERTFIITFGLFPAILDKNGYNSSYFKPDQFSLFPFH